MNKCIASRKLKRTCICCNREFYKGDVYYKNREVNTGYDGEWFVYAYETLKCPKCKYKEEQHKKRFKSFKDKCKHPNKFIRTEYSYISGECVMELDYNYCALCGSVV